MNPLNFAGTFYHVPAQVLPVSSLSTHVQEGNKHHRSLEDRVFLTGFQYNLPRSGEQYIQFTTESYNPDVTMVFDFDLIERLKSVGYTDIHYSLRERPADSNASSNTKTAVKKKLLLRSPEIMDRFQTWEKHIQSPEGYPLSIEWPPSVLLAMLQHSIGNLKPNGLQFKAAMKSIFDEFPVLHESTVPVKATMKSVIDGFPAVHKGSVRKTIRQWIIKNFKPAIAKAIIANSPLVEDSEAQAVKPHQKPGKVTRRSV